MDGVLAEVSQSYRRAIIATCHNYNASSVTHSVISEWKARGGCNNDWKLSLDLIKQDPNGSKDVTYEQVVETFEAFYQGSGETPGFCSTESLIPKKEVMDELRQRCHGRMAIVTGRPRKDCMKFLNQYKLADMFDVCVCMEDGPPKPDPFPVKKACELLGVECDSSVVMVGDTPDDIRSAVAAGCRGVGVATPNGVGREKCKLCESMRECGADLVMEPGFEELLDIFPKKE